MKPDRIQEVLSSIAEVAIFAWSLLELLFTRILPLVGFLVGYLLLQFGSLLSSVVNPPAAAGRLNQSPAAEYSFSWEDDQLQAVEEEILEEEEQNVQAVKEAADYDQGIVESFKRPGRDEEPEEIIPREEAFILPSLTADEEAEKPEEIIPREEASILTSATEDEEAEAVAPTADAEVSHSVLTKSAPLEGRVTHFDDTADEGAVRGASDSRHEHVAELSPLDVQKFDLHPSDIGGNNLDVDGVGARHVSPKPNVAGLEARHVSPKPVSSAEKMNLKPSDVQKSETSGPLGLGELQKNSSKRRSRRIGVLPPSLSQVKRTLMQRSRRASASPHSTSPANVLAPSPSPIQKKQLRGSRRRTSPPVLRSSPSYNSFVRRFREHFLLDPV